MYTGKYAKLSADYHLKIYSNRPEPNSSLLPSFICNLEQTSLTWGYFEGSKEPALCFKLQESPLSSGSSNGCCRCIRIANGSATSNKELTLVLHNQQELATWIRAIQILFANSEHQPVQQGDGGSVGDECTICLSEFEHGEILAVLPCGHRFHDECVREWLACSVKCPLCKRPSVDTNGQALCTSAQFSKK
jgi:hypothetical protein